jgi:hypothetical protein
LALLAAYPPAEHGSVLAGFLRGLALGLALAEADPAWASSAAAELAQGAGALWADEPPSRRPRPRAEARALLQRAGA